MDSDIGQASIIGYGRYTKTCIGTVQVSQCIKQAEKPDLQGTSAVEPEPQGAGTFGWSRSRSRNVEVSAPAPGQLE
jgi:hypothetical protein